MKNKGFTLIEVLGVVILIALLLLIVFPNIINFIKKSSDEKDALTKELIFSAADSYIKDHINDFPKVDELEFAIELKDLVDEGLLVSPIKYSDSDDITNDKCVQVTYSKDEDGYVYDLQDECQTKCVLTTNAINKSTYEFVKYAVLGDVVTCGAEQFYVIGISDQEGNITVPEERYEYQYSIMQDDIEKKDEEGNYINKLAMLSKYNLDVGYIYDTEGTLDRFTKITPASTSTYGIQNSKARALVSGQRYYYGVIEFSEPLKFGTEPLGGNSYWYSKEDSSCYTEKYKDCIEGLVANEGDVDYTNSYALFKINTDETGKTVNYITQCKSVNKEIDGTIYEYECTKYTPNPTFCYVYQSYECEGIEHSNLYTHVNNYVGYLNNKGFNVEGTIMSFEHAWSLSTTYSNAGVSNWLNNTSFWLGSAFNDTDILLKTSSGSFAWDGGSHLDIEDKDADGDGVYSGLNAGVRPVITMSIDNIVVQQET